MEHLCRFCGKKCETTRSIYKATYLNTPLNVILNIFKDLKVTQNDNLSQNFCDDCYEILKISYNFYNSFLVTQNVLNSFLQQHKSRNTQLKLILPKLEKTVFKCLKCAQDFASSEGLSQHLKNHFAKERLYRCYECPKLFRSTQALFKHKKNHFNPNICGYCNGFFEDAGTIGIHKEKFHDNSKYTCRRCSSTFARRQNLLIHIKKKHNINGMIFYCTHCSETEDYEGLEMLDEHLKVAHPSYQKDSDLHDEDFYMDEEFLDEFFLNEDDNFQFNENWDDISLNFEEEIKAPEQKLLDTIEKCSYKCPQCIKILHGHEDLNDHLAQWHGVSVFVCADCGLSFNKKNLLAEHKSQHRNSKTNAIGADYNTYPQIEKLLKNALNNQNFYKCSKCLDHFSTNQRFLLHSCPRKEEIPCEKCKQIFYTYNDIFKHYKKDHNEFKCEKCDKTFQSQVGYKYHIRIHNKLKPFLCAYCSKRFLIFRQLDSHMKTNHAENKIHECKLCYRKLPSLDHLKKHVLAHQNQKNFICSICGKGFLKKTEMEIQDLKKAKEAAEKEDFRRKWATADLEAEEGSQDTADLAAVTVLPSTSAAPDPWEDLAAQPLQPDWQHPTDSTDEEEGGPPRSVRNRRSVEREDFEIEGELEESKQTGDLAGLVARALQSTREDVRSVGDRHIEVDLTFIESPYKRERLKTILETVIKTYTSVPGQVQSLRVRDKGIYSFKVTNEFLSPDSDSSASSSVNIPSPAPVNPRRKETKHAIIPQLKEGIQLEPKFPGLPKKILRYGADGLTVSNVSHVKIQRPDLGLKHLLIHCLTESGNYRKIKNIYNFPQEI